MPHPTFFLKRKLYDKYGLYNTELRSAADYEMFLRLLYKYNITVNPPAGERTFTDNIDRVIRRSDGLSMKTSGI